MWGGGVIEGISRRCNKKATIRHQKSSVMGWIVVPFPQTHMLKSQPPVTQNMTVVQGLYGSNWVIMRSLGWAWINLTSILIQGGCLDTKICMKEKERERSGGEKEAIYKQRRGLGTDPSCWPWRGWFLSLGHPASRSCEQINVCGLIHLVCGALLWQP